MTESTYVLPSGIPYQAVPLNVQLPHDGLHRFFFRIRINIQRFTIRTQYLLVSHPQFIIQHQRISGHSYHTAYKYLPIAHRNLRRPGIRVIEQYNIPLSGSFSQPPPGRKRHTKPITPLIHQNPFPLIKAILHTGRGNGAGGESKCLYQQYQNDSSKHCFDPYRNTGHAQFFYPNLFNVIHKGKQSVPTYLSIQPATVIIQ